jgi:hypothetical protein
MAHDDFEIAIEQRLRGALDSAGTAALEEHLLGCPACRDYETRARAEQKGLQVMFANETMSVDWKLIDERVQRLRARIRRARYVEPVMFALFLVLMAVVKQWAHPEPLGIRVIPFATLIPLGAFIFALLARKNVRAQEAREAQLGAIGFYRETIARSVRVTRRGTWLAPLMVLAAFFLNRVVPDREIHLMTMLMLPYFLILAAYLRWVKLPRLLREQAELG